MRKGLGAFSALRAGSIDHTQLEKRYFGGWFLGLGELNSLYENSPSPLVLADGGGHHRTKESQTKPRYRHAAVIESSDDAIASGLWMELS